MKGNDILDISIYQLQLFFVAADENNFSRAAELMHMTQPTFSKQIQKLEEMLGAELFDRSKRPIELTPAGIVLYSRIKPFINEIEISLDIIRKEYGENTPTLSVGFPDSGKQMPPLQKAGKTLKDEEKSLIFSFRYISMHNWREMLNKGKIDIMYMIRMEEPYFEDSWQYERIMEVPKLICMLKTNPLSEKESITYEDLKTQRFVMNSLDTFPTHYKFVREQTMKYAGFEPKVARWVTTPHDTIPSLEGNDEVAVCDMFLRDIENDFVCCFELPDTYSGLDAVWKKDNKNPYIRHYIDLAKKYLEEDFPGTVL